MSGRHRKGRHRKPYRPGLGWAAAGAVVAAAIVPHHTTPAPVADVVVPVAAPVKPAVFKTAAPAVVAAAYTPRRQLVVTGRQGLTANAAALLAYIDATYPGVRTVGGVRADALPGHPSGRALDVMVTSSELGHQIVADVLAHATHLHIRYCIFERTLYYPSGRTQWMADRGGRTANHYDHTHLEVW